MTGWAKPRPRRRWWHSLQVRLAAGFLVLMAGVAAALLAVVQSILVDKSEEILRQAGSGVIQAVTQRVTLVEAKAQGLARIANRLPRDEMAARRVLSRLLDDGAISDLIAGGGIWPEPGRWQPEVTRRALFFARDSLGRLLYRDQYNDPDVPAYHGEPWYLIGKAATSDVCHWSSAYVDAYSLEPMVTCTVPIRDGGQFWGAVTIDLRTKGLAGFLAARTRGMGGYAFVLDGHDMLIYHPSLVRSGAAASGFLDADGHAAQYPAFGPVAALLAGHRRQILDEAARSGRFAPLRAALGPTGSNLMAALVLRAEQPRTESGPAGLGYLALGQDPALGESAAASLFLMPETGWKIGIVLPERLAAAGATEGVRRILPWLLGLLAAALLAAWALAGQLLVRPLRRMTRQLREAGASGEGRVVLDNSVMGEIGEVAHNFNRRSQALEDLSQRLAGVNQVLEAQVAERTRAFAEKSAQLQAAIDTMPQGIAMFGPDLELVIHNRLFLTLLEVQDLVLVAGDLLAEMVRQDGEREMTDGRVVEFRQARRAEGGYVVTVADVTERRRAQAALLEAKDQAEAATRAKSSFLATMSHEIRTPMNGVIGMLQLLDRTNLYRDQRQLVAVIRESAQALLTIIDDILDFSKIEAGRMTLESLPVRLLDLVEGVADLLAPKAAEKGLELVTLVEPGLPATQIGDPVRLRQILLNLAGNAVKFTAVGSVTLTAGRGPGGGCRIGVTDTGIGLSPDQIAQLFKPFSQADASTTRKFGGTGLGLSICRRLADLMGAELGVDSSPGQGSCFRLDLPPAPEGAPIVPPLAAEADLAGLSILVALSHPGARQAAAAYLRWAGAEVLAAGLAEGERALDLTFRAGPRFDLAVVDLPFLRAVFADRPEEAPAPPFRRLILADNPDPAMPWAAARLPEPARILARPMRRAALVRAAAQVAGRLVEESGAASAGQGPERWRPPSLAEAAAAEALILVAEDNPVNQLVIRKQLEELGYAAQFAADGVEALEALGQDGFGLLITDCHMPQMDGYDLARRIRQGDSRHRRLPIIALTASALAGDADRCREAGMDDYMSKPVDMAGLDQAIRRWLPAAVTLRRPAAAPPSASSPALHPPVAGPATAVILDPKLVAEAFGSLEDGKEMLGLFIETTAPLLGQLADAIAADDQDRARKRAHAIAGAARTAGAAELAGLCSAIERDLLSGQLDAARQQAGAVSSAFGRVEAAIRAL